MSVRESVWNTAPTSAPAQRGDRYTTGTAAHPAKMLPAIATHAIRTYTQPGDLVLDPMCGIGTTLVEAVHLGRHAFGTEYEPKWARVARANLVLATRQGATGRAAVTCSDARHLLAHLAPERHGTAALVITSPPYGPSVHGHVRSTRDSGERGVIKRHHRYSRDPHNLAHVSLDHLLDAFTEILIQCRKALRPGGHAVITTRPWREQGELIDLPSAVLAAAQPAGLVPVERCVALLAGIRAGRLIARPSFFQMKNVRDARRAGVPLAVIQHEDTLVFRRPETRAYSGQPKCRAGDARCATQAAHTPGTVCTFRSRTCTTGRHHDLR
ncbi:TRM11 family SAM-dependent methyltransferase [Streptomyces malaysiensis]|uniref:Methyltransferase n=1 Tax=Streptomyces malaysiensis TaxID=92644 RepID=A0A7X6B0H4_STRMQ|nr:DNA methyltransferase [Streptomyces malaysiensis]NIY69534.1 putative RNA methylase [Streptomyces malaysiensis]